MSRRGILLFALMSVIWGIAYLLIKIAVQDLSPGDAGVLPHRLRLPVAGPKPPGAHNARPRS